MARRLGTAITPLVACAVFLGSNSAWAMWVSFEYRNSDGASRYGIKDGSSKVRLGLADRKDADTTASAMNKAEAVDEAEANTSGDNKRNRDKNE